MDSMSFLQAPTQVTCAHFQRAAKSASAPSFVSRRFRRGEPHIMATLCCFVNTSLRDFFEAPLAAALPRGVEAPPAMGEGKYDRFRGRLEAPDCKFMAAPGPSSEGRGFQAAGPMPPGSHGGPISPPGPVARGRNCACRPAGHLRNRAGKPGSGPPPPRHPP